MFKPSSVIALVTACSGAALVCFAALSWHGAKGDARTLTLILTAPILVFGLALMIGGYRRFMRDDRQAANQAVGMTADERERHLTAVVAKHMRDLERESARRKPASPT